MGFEIYEIGIGGGIVALCPMPASDEDIALVKTWQPDMIVSLTEMHEGATATFETQFAQWVHAPIADFGVPDGPALDDVIGQSVGVVQSGGRVLFHCMGGCGRSGMAVLRVMCLMGVPDALAALRRVRPCAVETDEQVAWALRPAASP